jgi:N-acetyl sugar amidotransferase
MPNTRPGISFNSEGVCSACQAYENRKDVDYEARWEELKVLCDKHRKPNGYDCIVAVSGGKDSHFQVHVMKEKLGMNPLLVTVEDNFPMTQAGQHNLKNISKEFSCNIISLKPDIFAQKRIGRETFEKYGKPTYLIDRYIYTFPLHIAAKFNIPLVVYGENINYEYGGAQGETASAKEQVNNTVASGIDVGNLPYTDPPEEELEPIYLSYFVPWNGYANYLFAKTRGFRDLSHEWKRTHHIEDFDQVDSRAYLVHPWMKYPKFGHATATDQASRFIRAGMMSREEGFEIAREHDPKLDPLCVKDFCEFFGYTEEEFWAIVDKHYNQELFKKENGKWILK